MPSCLQYHIDCSGQNYSAWQGPFYPHESGTSEGEYQIRKNVLSVTKKITIEQGLESSSVDEKDIKEYIDMVITELKKKPK